RRADVGLRIEPQAKDFQQPADTAHQHRVELLHAHAAETRITFYAFVGIHIGAVLYRVDRNRSHRADSHAIATRHTLLLVDPHKGCTSIATISGLNWPQKGTKKRKKFCFVRLFFGSSQFWVVNSPLHATMADFVLKESSE